MRLHLAATQNFDGNIDGNMTNSEHKYTQTHLLAGRSKIHNVPADVVRNPSDPNPAASQWFSPQAFTAPQQPFRNGAASRNSLRGPALLDINTVNHVNLGQPNYYVDVSGAGEITYAAAPARQMQFGLHYRF